MPFALVNAIAARILHFETKVFKLDWASERAGRSRRLPGAGYSTR
jgi:hypothetical protein